jgi:nucleoside 2-deoxyribosyltransferase
MKKLKVYIAGPMRGYEKNNHDAFDKAEATLLKKGIWNPINPAAIDRFEGVDPHNDLTKKELKEALARDFNLIFTCDCMYMLLGWEKSMGARAEHALAVALGMGIQYQ